MILPVMALSLSACVVGTVAKTAVEVATLPVKAVSAGVDAATTSQSEADEKRGRALRKEEERAGKAQRKAEAKWIDQCENGENCPLPPTRDH